MSEPSQDSSGLKCLLLWRALTDHARLSKKRLALRWLHLFVYGGSRYRELLWLFALCARSRRFVERETMAAVRRILIGREILDQGYRKVRIV